MSQDVCKRKLSADRFDIGYSIFIIHRFFNILKYNHSMIKKYNKQKVPQAIGEQLEAYQQQATTYRQQTTKSVVKNLKKGTLTALIPLAAATAANAQCQGAQATVTLITGTNHSIDIDGGGKDFAFYIGGSGIGLSALGQNSLIVSNNYFAKRLNNNYVITTGKNFDTNGALCNSTSSSSYSFNLGHSATNNYIGIKKGTKLGFIRLTVLDCSGAEMKFRIDEMGYENDGNSAVTTGDCATLGGVLPVEMTYFKAKVNNQTIHLNWATATELNNAGFEIQRSTDGRLFHKIGWVEGQGTIEAATEYTFQDENIQPNVNYYYRLKQVDHDGTSEFSPVESAMVKNADMVEVGDFFPNPVTKDYPVAWLKVNLPQAVDGIFHIYNSQGALVRTINKSLAAGQNRLSLRLEGLTAGQYFVKLQMGDKYEYRKLVVK